MEIMRKYGTIPELKLKADALSSAESCYIQGLYLADGYALVKKGCYTIRFFLQGNEADIATRLACMLRKAGLNPRILIAESGEDDITVRTCSKQLALALPNKKDLLDNANSRKEFFKERKLFTVSGGIPFLAGLLDGDGSCPVKVSRTHSFRGVLNKWCWSFAQTRLPFLIDYVVRFMDSIAPDSVRVEVQKNSRKRVVYFRKSAISSLLDLGIREYSIKVEKWSDKSTRFERGFRAYHTVGETARILKVCPATVLNWIKAGKLLASRRTGKEKRKYWHYIADEEIARFAALLLRTRKRIERIRNDGVRIADLADMLRLSERTLRKWCQGGKLDGSLVVEGSHKYYVIPKLEVERLLMGKHKLGNKQKKESEDANE